jgi:hypothetical protein
MGDVSARNATNDCDRGSIASGGDHRLIPIDERVLDDLRHSLGNYFHKLYYWADYLKSGADDLGPEVSPVEMLDRTIQNLDGFLRIALEYFHTPDLACVTLTCEELGRSVASVLHSVKANPSVVVARPGVEHWRVAVDPSRFAEAVGIAARQIRAAADDQTSVIHATVAPAPAALRVELRLDGGGAPRPRRQVGVVEWAVAGRLLAAHGGSLESIGEEGAIAGCVIHMPAQAS